MFKNLNNFFKESKTFYIALFLYYFTIITCLFSYYYFLGFNINYILYYFWLLNVLFFIILKFCLKFGYFKQNSIILGYTLYDNFNKSKDPPLYTYIKDSYLITIFYFTVSTFIFILLYYYNINIFSINIFILFLMWLKALIRTQLDSIGHSTYADFEKYLNLLEKENIVLYTDHEGIDKKNGFYNFDIVKKLTPVIVCKVFKLIMPIAYICIICIIGLWVSNDLYKEIKGIV